VAESSTMQTAIQINERVATQPASQTERQTDGNVLCQSAGFHFHFKHLNTTETNKSFQRERFKQTTIRDEYIDFIAIEVSSHRPETS
jgi:DNA-binding transcriptional regulator YdaS (Cro superfamily)